MPQGLGDALQLLLSRFLNPKKRLILLQLRNETGNIRALGYNPAHNLTLVKKVHVR